MYVFDKEQEAAIKAKEDKILVVASAGSGKTFCLTERIKYLLDQGNDPKKMVAITFTNAAAEELIERIGKRGRDMFVGTVHSYANRLLLIGGLETKKYIVEEKFDEFFEEIKTHPEVLEEVEHLLVDEFQDTTNLQFEFFTDMINPKNFFYIGDQSQCIFSWAGANPNNFNYLERDPDVKVYYLNNNYRCGRNIVDFATDFLVSLKGYKAQKIVCKNSIIGEVTKQTFFNLNYIVELLKEDKEYKNWFILTRTNAEINLIENFLNKNGIPTESFKKSDLNSSQLKERIKRNTVKVLTVHSAKGLENDNVIVVGVVPYSQEEKRVAYVAATRARNRLIWFYKKPTQKKVKYEQW